MDEKDFEEMLKKSIEAMSEEHACDIFGDDMDEDMEIPENPILQAGRGNYKSLHRIIDIIKVYGLVDLGKAAQKKTDELISELTYILCNKKESMDEIHYRAFASSKIKSTERKLSALQTIMSAAAIGGGSAIGGRTEDPEKILDTILKLSML